MLIISMSRKPAFLQCVQIDKKQTQKPQTPQLHIQTHFSVILRKPELLKKLSRLVVIDIVGPASCLVFTD